MRIRTDDEVYRVDAVWLGPPKATFPFRARYVAYAVGIPLFFVVLGIERQLGLGFGVFSTAWALIATVVLTKLITAKINHERQLGSMFTMWAKELSTPRENKSGQGGAVTANKLRMQPERPRPRNRRKNDGITHPQQRELTQRHTPRVDRDRSAATSWR